MAYFDAYNDFWRGAEHLPDTAELRTRRVICDGLNPNLIVGRQEKDTRPFGVLPQSTDLAGTKGSGGSLTAGATYVYGVRRIVRNADGVDQARSSVITETVELSQSQDDYRLTTAAVSPDEVTDTIWARITAGYFRITVNGVSAEIGPVQLNFCATFAAMAANIAAAIVAEGGDFEDVEVSYDSSAGTFVFAAPTEIGYLETWYESDGSSKWDLAENLNYPANGQWVVTGSAHRLSNANTWAAIADGSLRITIGSTHYDITGIDFAGDTSMTQVAATIQAAIRAGDDVLDGVTVVSSGNLTSDIFTVTLPESAQTTLALGSVGSGTDISGNSGDGTYYMSCGRTGTGAAASVVQGNGDEQYTLLGGTEAAGAATSPPDNTDPSITITLEAYQQPPADGANWSIIYQILRSSADNPTMLYLLKELDQNAYDEDLTAGAYPDTAADEDLDTSVYVNLEEDLEDVWIPPCRFVAAWHGRFVFGGSTEYSRGTADVSDADPAVLTINSPGEMAYWDLGASVQIDGEDGEFLIADIVVSGGVVTGYVLDRKAASSHTAVNYVLYRDPSVVYVTPPLPEFVEGYTIGNAVYSNNRSAGPLQGLHVADGVCYIHRRDGIETLDGYAGNWSRFEIQGSPPGCVSHATFSGRYFYTGYGVYEMLGQEARDISGPVEKILEGTAPGDTVDHDYDGWTHGVWHPDAQRYYLWLFRSGDVITESESIVYRVPSLMLTWDAVREQWLAGELAASASGLWVDSFGRQYPVIGIGGGVAKLDSGSSDGADVSGTVTAAGDSTLTDSGAAFTDALIGLPVVVTAADGATQWAVVLSVAATQITVHGAWGSTPAAGSAYHIGAIRWHVETGELPGASDDNPPGMEYHYKHLALLHEPDTEEHTATMQMIPTRASAEKTGDALTFDMNGRELAETRRGDLRSRGVRIRISGGTVREFELLAIRIEAQATGEH